MASNDNDARITVRTYPERFGAPKRSRLAELWSGIRGWWWSRQFLRRLKRRPCRGCEFANRTGATWDAVRHDPWCRLVHPEGKEHGKG
jgi:hypothetical protein